MTTPIRTLLADIRAKKTCDLRQGRHVTDRFLAIPPHRVGVLHLAMEQRFLLADPVGAGKTPQALVAYAYLKEKDPSLRLVVVTLKSALFQWQIAVGKFLTGVTVVIPGYVEGRKQDARTRKWQWSLDKSDVLVTTYHTLARDLHAILPHWDNFVLVFDEVQTVRDWNQKSLFPAAQRLSQKARYCWGLSATPIMNRLEDLFAVYEAIYPGLLGGSLTAFQKTYLIQEYIKPIRRWKTKGHKNLDHLKALIAPYRLGRPIEEIAPHLPKVVNKPVLLDLGPKQRAFYDRIARTGLVPQGESPIPPGERAMPSEPPQLDANLTLDSLGEIGDLGGESGPAPKLVGGRKLAALLYAQMAADAPAVLGHPDVPAVKWTELRRFLEEECGNGEKVVVFTRFERVVTWLAAQLSAAGITNTRITGRESATVREAHRVAFQSDPALQVMLINGVAGSALDLQAAGIVVFYDLPWSWGMYTQILGRCRRIGTSHSVVLALQLLTTDTIDIYTSNLLHSKESIVDLAFDLSNSDRIFTAPSPIALASALSSSSSNDPVDVVGTSLSFPSLDLDLLFAAVSTGNLRTAKPTLPVPDRMAGSAVETDDVTSHD